MSGTHSVLAPSDSERWLRCVGALYMSKGLPSLDKEYNASGTCSHWLGEWALRNPDRDLNDWLGKEMTFGDEPKFSFKIDEERIARVRVYVDAINREPGMRMFEQRLDTTPVLGIPNQEGHADTVILYPEGGVVKDEKLLRGVISVHDFKDGYILVNAKDNTQGLLYLCAAMMTYSLVGEYQAFRFCIHQPKMNHYDEWTYTRAELTYFMEMVRPIAKLAHAIYTGAIAFDGTQHLTATDAGCQWCPVRGRCPARARYIVQLFEPVINRHELDTAALGELYAKLDAVEGAVRDFRAEALRRAMVGDVIAGQKLVQGRHGPRKYKDKAAASQALELLLGPAAYEPREPISPTQAEHLLKKGYAAIADLVTQSEGSWKLVPIDDKRDSVKTGADAFAPVKEPT